MRAAMQACVLFAQATFCHALPGAFRHALPGAFRRALPGALSGRRFGACIAPRAAVRHGDTPLHSAAAPARQPRRPRSPLTRVQPARLRARACASAACRRRRRCNREHVRPRIKVRRAAPLVYWVRQRGARLAVVGPRQHACSGRPDVRGSGRRCERLARDGGAQRWPTPHSRVGCAHSGAGQRRRPAARPSRGRQGRVPGGAAGGARARRAGARSGCSPDRAALRTAAGRTRAGRAGRGAGRLPQVRARPCGAPSALACVYMSAPVNAGHEKCCSGALG